MTATQTADLPPQPQPQPQPAAADAEYARRVYARAARMGYAAFERVAATRDAVAAAGLTRELAPAERETLADAHATCEAYLDWVYRSPIDKPVRVTPARRGTPVRSRRGQLFRGR